MIRLVLAILAALALVGYIGGKDVQRCIDAGRSAENCYAQYNP